MDQGSFAAEHLQLRLAVLNRACRAAAAAQQIEAAQLDRPDLAAHAITDRQVTVLLERVDRLTTAIDPWPAEPVIQPADLAAEETLRARTCATGAGLPLDTLAACFGLTQLDKQALVAVLAPELDRGYERIYAYLCDEFDRRHPSVELLAVLTHGLADRPGQRLALGPFGALRRQRLLLAYGDAPSDLRQQLRLAPGLLEFLLGAPVDVRCIGGEPGAVEFAGHPDDVVCEPYQAGELAAALRTGTADLVAVWGRREAAAGAAAAVAAALGLALHRVPHAHDPERAGGMFREAAIGAAMAQALLWLPVELDDDPPASLLDAVAAALEATSTPVLISAAVPWRPVGVLTRRKVVEVRAALAGPDRRARAWQSRHPGLADADALDLATRFPLGPAAAVAASRLAATGVGPGQGGPVPLAALEAACAALSTPRPNGLVSVIEPRRGPDDLILPAQLHRQVVELAAFARSLPALAGTGRPTVTQRGLKVLFTGEPGTGKTLAAEVIAGLLSVQLVTVDLSRVVSKWVGETAKHLDAVFRLADGSSAILFFDEADALFGKRGEVTHGSDRYANTEVSHLLQRFEAHDGLVILATNQLERIRENLCRALDQATRTTLEGCWKTLRNQTTQATQPVDCTDIVNLDCQKLLNDVLKLAPDKLAEALAGWRRQAKHTQTCVDQVDKAFDDLADFPEKLQNLIADLKSRADTIDDALAKPGNDAQRSYVEYLALHHDFCELWNKLITAAAYTCQLKFVFVQLLQMHQAWICLQVAIDGADQRTSFEDAAKQAKAKNLVDLVLECAMPAQPDDSARPPGDCPPPADCPPTPTPPPAQTTEGPCTAG